MLQSPLYNLAAIDPLKSVLEKIEAISANFYGVKRSRVVNITG